MQPGIDYTGVSVTFFCYAGSSYVMGWRTDKCRDEKDRWAIGSGAIEVGEPILEALHREVKEEYCARITSYEALGYREVRREISGIPTHWISFDFKVQVDPSTVQVGEPEKHPELKWYPFGYYPENCHSQFPRFLKNHWTRLGGSNPWTCTGICAPSFGVMSE